MSGSGGTAHALLEVTPPARWLLLATLAGVVASALACALLCDVTLTSHGPGKLRTDVEPRHIVSEVAGTVEQLLASPGQCVKRGDSLVQVASAPIRSDLLRADRRLQLARERSRHVETEGRRSFELRIAELEKKQALLERMSRRAGVRTRQLHPARTARRLRRRAAGASRRRDRRGRSGPRCARRVCRRTSNSAGPGAVTGHARGLGTLQAGSGAPPFAAPPPSRARPGTVAPRETGLQRSSVA